MLVAFIIPYPWLDIMSYGSMNRMKGQKYQEDMTIL